MDKRALDVAERWWMEMAQVNKGERDRKPNPASTVFRAQLRRADTLEAALATDGFRDLWLKLPPEETSGPWVEQRMELWAIVAALAPHVEFDAEALTNINASIASCAGRLGPGDKPVVSTLRFKQLLASRTAEELLRRLRRMLKQVQGKVCFKRLVRDVEAWLRQCDQALQISPADRITIRWAMEYYDNAKIRTAS